MKNVDRPPMTITQIKSLAKEVATFTPRRYPFFVAPVLLQAMIIWVFLHQTSHFDTPDTGLATVLLPQLLNFFLMTFMASAAISMMAIIRRQSPILRFVDSSLIFDKVYLWKFIKLRLTYAIKLLPCTLVIYLAPLLGDKLSLGTKGLLLVAMILAAVGLIYQMLSYALINFILFDQIGTESYINSLDILRFSRTLMKGHRLHYLFLELSFIGWHLLNVMTLGLIGFFFLPYQLTSEIIFYQDRLNLFLERKAIAKELSNLLDILNKTPQELDQEEVEEDDLPD